MMHYCGKENWLCFHVFKRKKRKENNILLPELKHNKVVDYYLKPYSIADVTYQIWLLNCVHLVCSVSAMSATSLPHVCSGRGNKGTATLWIGTKRGRI